MELFDKSGNQVDLKECVSEIIKENLQITASIDQVYDYGKTYQVITVKLFLYNEEISSDSVTIYPTD